MQLKQKALAAGIWVGASTIFSRIVSFSTTLFLAKLLTPEDFGIVAVASLVVMSIGLFREMGINRALIYQKQNIPEAASTAFYLILIVSSLLYIAAFLSAPFFAAFFQDTRVTAVVRVLSIGIVISAFSEVQSALLEKEILFKKTAIPEAIFFIVYGLSSITLAYFGFSYWSIVSAQLIAGFSRTVCFWAISDWRPAPDFNKIIATKLIGYGKHVLGATVVNFGIRNIDDAFVGRMLSKSTLGAYYLAYRIANIPPTAITNAVGRIMFPVYSKLPNRAFDLRNAFSKTLRLTSVLTVPASFFIFAYISDFLTVLYQDKWIEAVVPIQILCFYGLMRSLGSGMGGIFLATGRPDIPFKLSLVQLLFLASTLYPAIKLLGIVGVCIIGDIGVLISVSLHYVRLKKIIESSLRQVLITISPFLLYSVISIAAGKILGTFAFTIPSMHSFAFEILISTLMYLVLVLIFSRDVIEPFCKLPAR
jgi:O-antigen/teichoic acid export membrane protein